MLKVNDFFESVSQAPHFDFQSETYQTNYNTASQL